MLNIHRRVAAIIIKKNKILLMRRVRGKREYFVFPGGGVKQDESFPNAIAREIKEELGLDVKLDKLLFRIKNQGRQEFYFLIKKFSGVPQLGGEEKKRMSQSNQYYPIWFNLAELPELSNLYPEKAKQIVMSKFCL